MGYTVQFIGLMCFQSREQGRRVLLPDGRFPEDRFTSPHIPSISVRRDQVLSYDGWREDQVSADPWEMEFGFLPSEITLPFGNHKDAAYTEAESFTRVPKLSDMAEYTIDYDKANWVASIPILEGQVEAYRVTNLPNAPLIGQLRVDYEGEIEIVVTARKGWPRRSLLLKPESEVAIINTSRGLPPRTDALNHFQIYAELSTVPVTFEGPSLDTSTFDESQSRHPALRQSRPATFIDSNCIIVTN